VYSSLVGIMVMWECTWENNKGTTWNIDLYSILVT
jgi:hypothetical protein